MRVRTLVLLAVFAVACTASAQDGVLGPVSTSSAAYTAGAAATVVNGPRSKVSMWIWSDKYTYQPGELLTLKWTVKTNGDLYPYTVFVYRQNNQTGAKNYYPGGGDSVVDINGNSRDQGFQPVQLTNSTKAVLMGSGGRFSPLTIPNEPGMHTLAVQLRDYTGTRVIKTAYMKIGVVTGVTTISAPITSNQTFTNDRQWNLSGIIYVKDGATLTIQPGTFVVGNPGTQPPSALIVTQNGKIIAEGTKSRPIIMTSSLPIGQRTRGDWGGLVLLGKAPINVAANTQGGICPTGGCTNQAGTFYIEGLVGNEDSLYGGSDPNWNCGTLRYVRVEYAGTILSPNNELNSFTFGGCGKGTTMEHLQAIYGKDDCFEWFGGSNDAKYLVGGLCADDFTDYQLGTTARVQFGLMYQSPDARGNRGVEGDNSEYDQAATPVSNPTFFNITYIGSGNPGFDESNAPGLFLRRGSNGSFNNLVFTNFFSPCIDINDASTQAQADAGKVKENGILCWRNNLGGSGSNGPADTLAGNIPAAGANGTYSQAYALGQKGNGAGKNFVIADPLITRPFEYSDPDFSGMFASPLFRTGFVSPPDDGFFDQSAKFVGGIGDEDWTEEWTNFHVEEDVAP